MNYQKEQQEWDQFVTQEIGAEAKLRSISVSSSDCRVYSLADRVYKVKRLTPASIRGRLNSLEDEFLVMNNLTNIPSIATPCSYKRLEQWELLEMTEIKPLPIHDPTFGQPNESLKDFFQVVSFAWALNRRGCSHGDYHFQNIGRNVDGLLSAFDFDQAFVANPLLCWMRDFWGIGSLARRTDISLLQRARKVQYIWPVIAAFNLLRKTMVKAVRAIQGQRGSSALPFPTQVRAALLKDGNLNTLAEAWGVAANSNASSPGLPLAYYSLDVSGVNFPGERPWLLRWNDINQAIDFKGKKFLELGCNMGLLATHAKLNGAIACLGVDVDLDIVKAASLASKAFGAEVKFKQLNLDDPRHWEAEIADYDIVSALSVMHWISDKKRAWSFLAQHGEIVYEGHESDIEAEENLRKIGFTNIHSIGQSERGRQVFYATKKA